jgi:hypothetical protein
MARRLPCHRAPPCPLWRWMGRPVVSAHLRAQGARACGYWSKLLDAHAAQTTMRGGSEHREKAGHISKGRLRGSAVTRAAFCPSRRDATPTPGRRGSPGKGPPARRRAEAHPKSNPSPDYCSNSNHSGRPSSRGVSIPRSSPVPKNPRASEGKSQAAPQSLPYEYGVLADKSTPAAALGREHRPTAPLQPWAACSSLLALHRTSSYSAFVVATKRGGVSAARVRATSPVSPTRRPRSELSYG